MADPNNYFFDFHTIIEQDDIHSLEILERLETVLNSLDPHAWSTLMKKCLPFACGNHKNKNRGWSQFVNHLFEAKGYLFLKNSGYQEVNFIPNKKTGTPDLMGKNSVSNALLEVKCINHSDCFLKCISQNELISVPFDFFEKLKAKITSTVEKAKEQLTSYESGIFYDRKICLLLIDLDLHASSNEIEAELESFLLGLSNSIPEIEIFFEWIRHKITM